MNTQVALRLSNTTSFYVRNFLQTQRIPVCECKRDCRCQNLIVISEPNYLKSFGIDLKNTIVLTSNLEEEVYCYSLGVTICHRKPINFRLLGVQIFSLIKEKQNHHHIFGNLKLDNLTQAIYKNNSELRLTRSEFNLLSILIRKKGMILTKSEVCTKVIDGNVMSYRALDTLVSRLRKKVEDEARASTRASIKIETIYGMGFRLKE